MRIFFSHTRQNKTAISLNRLLPKCLKEHTLENKETNKVDIIWNFGISCKTKGFYITLNDKSTSKITSNKLLLYRHLENQVQVPPFTQRKPSYNWIPCIARIASMSRANGMRLCLQKRDFRAYADFYVKYIPTQKEFRVHIFAGEIIDITEKVLKQQSIFGGPVCIWTRNNNNCWYKSIKKIPIHLQDIANQFSKVLPNFVGAIDILYGDDKQYYVIDANTSPGLNLKRQELYIKGLKDLIKDYGG